MSWRDRADRGAEPDGHAVGNSRCGNSRPPLASPDDHRPDRGDCLYPRGQHSRRPEGRQRGVRRGRRASPADARRPIREPHAGAFRSHCHEILWCATFRHLAGAMTSTSPPDAVRPWPPPLLTKRRPCHIRPPAAMRRRLQSHGQLRPGIAARCWKAAHFWLASRSPEHRQVPASGVTAAPAIAREPGQWPLRRQLQSAAAAEAASDNRKDQARTCGRAGA